MSNSSIHFQPGNTNNYAHSHSPYTIQVNDELKKEVFSAVESISIEESELNASTDQLSHDVIEKKFVLLQKQMALARNLGNPNTVTTIKQGFSLTDLSEKTAKQNSRQPKENEIDTEMLKTGRKPLRLIGLEVKKKLEALVSSRAEYEALESRVKKYALESSLKDDGKLKVKIRENKKLAGKSTHEFKIKTLKTKGLQSETHQDQLLQRKKEIDSAKLIKTIESVKRKDPVAGALMEKAFNAKNTSEEAELAAKLRLKSQAQKQEMIEAQEKELLQQRISLAVPLLQSTWRSYAARKLLDKQNNAARIIQRSYFYHKNRVLVSKKQEAANLIQRYLIHGGESLKFQKLVCGFRTSVIQCQNIWRHALEGRRARIHVISLLWDALIDRIGVRKKSIKKKSYGKERKEPKMLEIESFIKRRKDEGNGKRFPTETEMLEMISNAGIHLKSSNELAL